MDRTTQTTRKGFMKRAGLAFAGIFALNQTSHATTAGRGVGSTVNENLPAMSRVRTAIGAVKHDTVANLTER